MTRRRQLNVSHRQPCRTGQRINRRDSDILRELSRQINRGTQWRGQQHLADAAHFVVSRSVSPHHHTPLAAAVAVVAFVTGAGSPLGIVLLIGIVKKNAIMMIDFAIAAMREQGMDPETAIRQAALLRFRPIMMTTFAALFAALPMIFGTGMGHELRQPLGLAIAGGLILSQVLTLFTTPVIFLGFERWRERRAAR